MLYNALNGLKNTAVRDYDTEEIALIAANYACLATGYKSAGLDVPDWLAEKQREAKAELDARNRADKQQLLKNYKSRREANKLKTDAGLDAVITELEKELAG